MFVIKHRLPEASHSKEPFTLLHLSRGITCEEAIQITLLLQKNRPDEDIHLVEVINRPHHVTIDLNQRDEEDEG